MFKRASRLAAIALAIAAAGCSGSDGAQGPQGPQGAPGADGRAGTDYTAALKPEACAGCHRGSGDYHQAQYDRYTNGTSYTLSIDDVQTVGTTSAMKFSITTDGTTPYVDPNLTFVDQKTYYAVLYNPANRQFTPSFSYANPSPTGVDGQYVVTTASTGAGALFAPEAAGSVAMVYAYIAKNQLKVESTYQLYDDVVNVARVFGGTLDYVSAANVSACEKCHGAPYQKHGYRAARVAGVPDFAACKTCHYDTRKGGHEAWQLLADNPLAYANQNGVPDAAQKAMYPYVASVMNDTHMAHAMEFAYPQSMANCVTCHEGKLASVFADANMKLSTCKSCHPMYGPQARGQTAYVDDKRAPALQPVMISTTTGADAYHASFAGTAADPKLYTTAANTTCNGCHATGNGMGAPTFAEMHNGGYDRKIYTQAKDGTKYADEFAVTIDAATLTTQTLTVSFSATKTGVDPATVASITPTVIMGLYGYDTKDLIVDAHTRDATGQRATEWTYGATNHPRFKALKALPRTDGKFQFKFDMYDYKAMLDDKTIKRVEIAIVPTLKLADGTVVAVKSPTRTFDFARKAFDDGFFQPIVDSNKCNACHAALGTTFHTADRGNVVTCRMCHNTRSGASHLETQSRSIDSYVHAIHNMQPFDPGDVDFTDPVEKLRYEHHVESTYPLFTTLACESCHNPGTYSGPPSQGGSLPGLHSPTDALAGWNRAITAVPSYVQGPGARACGACHRARALNEENDGALKATNEHFRANGYLLQETGGVLQTAIDTIMSIFK